MSESVFDRQKDDYIGRVLDDKSVRELQKEEREYIARVTKGSNRRKKRLLQSPVTNEVAQLDLPPVVDYVPRRMEPIIVQPIINVTLPPSAPIPAPQVTVPVQVDVQPAPVSVPAPDVKVQVDVNPTPVNIDVQTPEPKVVIKNQIDVAVPEAPPAQVNVVNQIDVQPAEVTVIKDPAPEKKEVKVVTIEKTADGQYKGTVEEK